MPTWLIFISGVILGVVIAAPIGFFSFALIQMAKQEPDWRLYAPQWSRYAAKRSSPDD